MRWLWIFVGGGLGSVSRVALGQLVFARLGPGLPWHTFVVNVLGCLAIGAAAAWLDRRGDPPATHAFLLAGFLGGFTTFSTFGLETLQLLQAARPGAAALNVAGSVVLGLVAVALGFAVVRSWA